MIDVNEKSIVEDSNAFLTIDAYHIDNVNTFVSYKDKTLYVLIHYRKELVRLEYDYHLDLYAFKDSQEIYKGEVLTDISKDTKIINSDYQRRYGDLRLVVID